MSLILAIEPDRRQVAQLISIVRQVPGAELILADTTERALESIGNGVPDLILVPALLSPQDDAALAAALRVIATAAHVQMLTIPTFATAKARPKSRGVLSAFRRKPVEDAPLEGCDPKVFAEQISSYLERASEERAAAQLLEDDAEMAADPYAVPAQQFGDLPAGFEEVAELAETATPAVEDIYAEPIQELSFETAPEPPMLAAEELAEEAIETAEQLEPIVADRYVDVEALPEVSIAAAAPEPMALEEFAATLARTELPSVVMPRTEPLMASAPAEHVSDESFELDLDIDLTPELEEVVPEVTFASSEPLPTLDAFLADFEHADLPVIEEVRAEQWMDTAAQPEEEEAAEEDDEQTQADIDLSIELEAVLHVEAAEPDASLKSFEPVVPVERFEPYPLAVWQSWPRLEGTGSTASQDDGSDDSAGADAQIAEFEAALVEAVQEEIFERFEPVVPVESVEPMPLAAWQCWPRLEGVVAEAYQEPIAPRKTVARPEWVELMRSLREDIARRRAELKSPAQAQAAPAPQVAQTAPSAQKPRPPRPPVATQAAKPAPAAPDSAAAAADTLNKRPKRTRPIEDEWGLFDPEQCGFAALLDKLDEITVPPPGSHPRR